MSVKLRGALRDFGVITLASAVYAVAFNWFFLPNDLTMGGFTGAAQILNFLLPALPIGVTTIVMNIPLFVVGVRLSGWRLLLSSLYAMAVSSLLLDLVDSLYTFQPMEPLLACLYGGTLLGASMGMMLLVNATTGGTELLARLLKFKFRHLSIGRLCLIVDVIIVCLYTLVFRNIHNALYSIIAIYLSSRAIDLVIYGSRTAQLAYIISGKSEEIAGALLELNLGITLLPATGGFSGDPKQVILCAFKRHHITHIKSLVHSIDPNAFLIVCQAHEVLGEGFGDYSQESL
mgnify:FL=1